VPWHNGVRPNARRPGVARRRRELHHLEIARGRQRENQRGTARADVQVPASGSVAIDASPARTTVPAATGGETRRIGNAIAHRTRERTAASLFPSAATVQCCMRPRVFIEHPCRSRVGRRSGSGIWVLDHGVPLRRALTSSAGRVECSRAPSPIVDRHSGDGRTFSPR
jgi:hypothetical protein